MIQIGKYHHLVVVKKNEKGYELNKKMTSEDEFVFLSLSETKEPLEIGQGIDVFVYRNGKDELVATFKEPKITLGTMAVLKVVSVNHIGAFLEWGMDKDLFLPFKQQLYKIHKGEQYLVYMYQDKSGRLCATMNIYDHLLSETPFKVNDTVEGTIYQIKPPFGTFVAVQNQYHGMIPLKEMYGTYKEGMSITGRVTKVREDGKLELSLRKPIHLQIEEDAQKIMDALEQYSGKLPLHDKSSPEEINDYFQMSKAAFKRALGRLLKEGAITINEVGIKRNW